MTDETKPKTEKQVENLELNRETVQDLSEELSEQAQGGRAANCSAAITSCGGTFQNCCA